MIDNPPSSANGPPSLKDRVKELQLSGQLGAGGKGSSTTWLPWMLCFLMALAWGGFGIHYYRSGGGSGAPDPNAAKTKTPPPTLAPGEIVLESKGYLIPSNSIPISPIDVAGRVIELYIEEGKPFKKGEVLAVIDSTRFQADFDEAKAQVEAAEARFQESKLSLQFERDQADAELAEAKAQAASAEIEYMTAKSTTVGAVSRQDLATLLKKWESAKEHVNVMIVKRSLAFGTPRDKRILAAEKDRVAAKFRQDRAQWSLNNCTIKAPVTGVILTKKAEKDSLINPVVGGVSTSLCEIADLSKLEVDLEIQERDIAKIYDDMVCIVRADAWPTREYKGYVDRSMPIANRARGIIPVRVRVILPPEEKQGRYLKPEMGVSVTFYNTKDESLRAAFEAKAKEAADKSDPPKSEKKK